MELELPRILSEHFFLIGCIGLLRLLLEVCLLFELCLRLGLELIEFATQDCQLLRYLCFRVICFEVHGEEALFDLLILCCQVLVLLLTLVRDATAHAPHAAVDVPELARHDLLDVLDSAHREVLEVHLLRSHQYLSVRFCGLRLQKVVRGRHHLPVSCLGWELDVHHNVASIGGGRRSRGRLLAMLYTAGGNRSARHVTRATNV